MSQENEQIQQIQQNKEKYLKQMSPMERRTYEIAKEHLESSFCIEKSIGFMKFCENEANKGKK